MREERRLDHSLTSSEAVNYYGSSDFSRFLSMCGTKNEVRTIPWATCQINTVICRSSSESDDLESSFSLYIHLVVYTNMICLTAIPFC